MSTFAFCPQCGQSLPAGDPLHQTCAGCATIHYKNPTPVAVALLRVDDGLLIGQRNISPKRGEWALPGGFIEEGENAQMGAARELFEETGLVVPSEAFRVIDTLVTPPGTQLLIFCEGPRLTRAEFDALQGALPADHPETQALGVMTPSQVLAFPLHTKVAHALLAG